MSEFIIRYEPSPVNTITSRSGSAIWPLAAGDLVAHAGEAELAVEGADRLRLPVLAQLAGQAARRGQREVGRIARPVDRADHVRVGGQRHVGRPGADRPSGSTPRTPWRRAPATPAARASRQPGRQLGEALLGVADGERPVLGGIEPGGVQRDQPDLGVAEHAPRAGGEILEPRADREHHVGLGGERVGGALPITPSGPALWG